MRLLADIGGTNARFALATRAGAVEKRHVFKVASFDRFEDALSAFLSKTGVQPTVVALSVAGPVIDNRVNLTNANWTISAQAVWSVCPDVSVQIVNDLAAVALAVPAMMPDDFLVLHPGAPADEPLPIVSINIGTGFGVAVSIPRPDGWLALPTEAGHMTCSSGDRQEREWLGDGVTIEDVFSGPALRLLTDQSAAAGIDDAKFRAVYSRSFGRLAGDIALCVGAWGGIALCGGVITEFDRHFDRQAFLSGLHTRTGLANRLKDVPVRRIMHPDPAFTGLLQLPYGNAA